jgi:O-antigen/teichoic acid export membrane protein
MRRRLTAGAPALAVTYFGNEFCGLMRMAMFAHVLAPTSMGVVVILGTWLRFVEMVTDVAIDLYLLRATDGAARNVQSAAHGTAIMRGAAGTAFMLASLLPMLSIYGQEASLAPFLTTALVPFIRGFTHFDYRLHNRLLRFGSTITVEIGSSLAGLAAAVSVFALQSVEAFAVALLIQAAAAVILSHLCAHRKYRVTFDAAIQRRLWQAGWPLAVNALLLYAVYQGEKLFVGGVLGLAVLGSYAIAAQLALLPVLIAGRLSIALVLPVLSRAGGDTVRGIQARQDVNQFFAAAGIFFWLGFVALAPVVIMLLFGEAYVQSAADMSWIAAAAALRLQKTGPVATLMASNRSREILAGNFVRLLSVAIGTACMVVTRDLTVFLAVTAVGEGISYAMATRHACIGAFPLLSPIPVLAVAAVQSFSPFSAELAIPLASLLVAGSSYALLRMGLRLLRAPRTALQQAGG